MLLRYSKLIVFHVFLTAGALALCSNGGGGSNSGGSSSGNGKKSNSIDCEDLLLTEVSVVFSLDATLNDSCSSTGLNHCPPLPSSDWFTAGFQWQFQQKRGSVQSVIDGCDGSGTFNYWQLPILEDSTEPCSFQVKTHNSTQHTVLTVQFASDCSYCVPEKRAIWEGLLDIPPGTDSIQVELNLHPASVDPNEEIFGGC